MNVVARNVIANALGGGVGILLKLIAVPIQIHILGAEAYGLVGFITSLQIVLVLFDLGLPSTIIREVAADREAERTLSRALVQTCSTIYWLVVIVAGLVFVLAGDWIANHWLHVESLSPAYVAVALRMLALYIVFTWPLGIYSSTLAGLQRFEILNTLKVITVIAGQLGGIVVLLLTHDLLALVIWWVFSAVAILAAYIWICYRLLPGLSLKPRISRWVIRRVWKFAFDLNLISTLAVVYTQTDRLLISALLPLRMLGYYNVAYNVSFQVGTIQEFINTAMMPALASKTSQQQSDSLNKIYLQYTQLLVYVITLPGIVLIFFGYDILRAWMSTEIAQNASLALSLLSAGFLMNAAVSTCYTLAIATGHSRIPLLVNIVGLAIYLPGMVYLLTNHMLAGAALGWVLLNLYYLATLMPVTQWRVLHSSALVWLEHILPFAGVGVIVFGIGRLVILRQSSEWLWVAVCFGCAVCYAIITFFFLAPTIRQQIIKIPRQILARISV